MRYNHRSSAFAAALIAGGLGCTALDADALTPQAKVDIAVGAGVLEHSHYSCGEGSCPTGPIGQYPPVTQRTWGAALLLRAHPRFLISTTLGHTTSTVGTCSGGSATPQCDATAPFQGTFASATAFSTGRRSGFGLGVVIAKEPPSDDPYGIVRDPARYRIAPRLYARLGSLARTHVELDIKGHSNPGDMPMSSLALAGGSVGVTPVFGSVAWGSTPYNHDANVFTLALGATFRRRASVVVAHHTWTSGVSGTTVGLHILRQ